MTNFEYAISVIVPVYNVEQYLRSCLDSLLAQTIEHEQMEVLLINDGSTDSSPDICREYEHFFPSIRIFSQENMGVSAARNVGIKNARGRYIAFLDSDDTLEPQSLKKIVDFFDNHYNEVDLVTYYDRYFINGKEVSPHLKYKYLTKTGIYDLKKDIFAFQLRLSIAFKNKGKENILFSEDISFQEDQKFCCELLLDNLKIGYVKEAVYNYMRNDSGLVATASYPLYSFENSIRFFEEIFSKFDEVPEYYQALYFHDISWKFAESVLFPYHYEESKLKDAKNRIFQLLDKVSNHVIMSYPSMDNYQKLFWIRQKAARNETLIFKPNQIRLLDGVNKLYERQNIEIILKRVMVRRKKLKLVGYFKSPFFSYTDDYKLLLRINGEYEELPYISASSSYYKGKEKTDTFWTLIFEREIEEYTQIEFFVEFSGIIYETTFWNGSTTPFYKGFTKEYSAGELKIKQIKCGFELTPLNGVSADVEVSDSIRKCTNNVSDSEIKQIRNIYRPSQKRIWLYYDNNTVMKDNGYYQFISDIDKDDGVERYYVHTYHDRDDSSLYDNKIQPYVVEFGCLRHKLLFLDAEKILTSFIETESIVPFPTNRSYQICDIFNAEIIYLQHGILHAHLPWYYTPIGVSVDKVVISSYFEQTNFVSIYGFRKEDLIPTGMARYDYISKNKIPEKRKILFAPSWRSYLIGGIKEGNQKRTGNDAKFMNSDYFKNISEFLSNSRLKDKLQEDNIELWVKLHPNFLSTYGHLINFESNNVILAPPNVQLNEFSLFITDFSSFVFDYAYLGRPIMYFVPDYLQFISGMNRYRELDLPWEEAFGNLTKDPESAVEEIFRIIDNNFVADKVFKERMDSFYLPMDNSAEGLYQYLKNN